MQRRRSIIPDVFRPTRPLLILFYFVCVFMLHMFVSSVGLSS